MFIKNKFNLDDNVYFIHYDLPYRIETGKIISLIIKNNNVYYEILTKDNRTITNTEDGIAKSVEELRENFIKNIDKELPLW